MPKVSPTFSEYVIRAPGGKQYLENGRRAYSYRRLLSAPILKRYRRTFGEVLVSWTLPGDSICGMKPFICEASVIWRGSHANGEGAVSTPSEVLNKALYSLGRHIKSRGTNPPELIAAAHAGSFSIALANELGDEGYNPKQIDTTVTVTMEDIPAGWTMTQIHVDVIATVPRALQCDFIDAAMRAKLSCPISRLLNANISMRAKLKRRLNGGRMQPKDERSGTPKQRRKEGRESRPTHEKTIRV